MKIRAALVTVVLASLLAATPAAPASAVIPDPTTDPFFVAPANLADLAPGTVIRKRPVAVKLLGYSGFGLPIAAEMIPAALPWLLARFDGKAFQGNCPA